MLRERIKEAERNSSIIDEILEKDESPAEFIDLYMKRNPHSLHESFMQYYKELCVDSQVLLYRRTREMVRDDEFERRLILRYCIGEQSELSCEIIRGVRNSRALFGILVEEFRESISASPELDLHICRCLVIALQHHRIGEHEMELVSAITLHFNDIRRCYHEHGAIVASVLLSTAEFNVGEMEEAKRIIDVLPESILFHEKAEEFRNPNDVFNGFEEVENDQDVFESRWRPLYLQEGIRIIGEEKDDEKIRLTYKHFPELVSRCTDRVISARGRDAYEALMGYDGHEEYKVLAIASLLQRAFDGIIDGVLDGLFAGTLCLRFKVILLLSLKIVARDGSFHQAKRILDDLAFRSRRAQMHERAMACVRDVIATCFMRFGREIQPADWL
jgi:hypothetical protein